MYLLIVIIKEMFKQSILVCLIFLSFGSLFAQNNGTVTGKFTAEHPTLLNLGFEWSISGDKNRNASG